MASAAEREYWRLPGWGTNFLGGAFRLWRGKDHLLSVEFKWCTEYYKRFYFRDIQALVVYRTKRAAIWNCIFSGVALIWFLTMLSVSGFNAAMAGVWGGFCVLTLLINLALGPTCRCYLRTAVQTEELPSLRRLRNARKAFQLLKPLVEEFQGRLLPEELPALIAQAPQVAAPPSALKAHGEVTRHYNGKAHEVLCFCLLLYGAVCLLPVFSHAAPVQFLILLFSLAVFGASFTAIIKQHQTDIPQGLRAVVFFSAIYISVSAYLCFIGSALMFTIHQRQVNIEPTELSLTGYMQFISLPVVGVITALITLPLGGIGLQQLSEFRRNYKPPALPSRDREGAVKADKPLADALPSRNREGAVKADKPLADARGSETNTEEAARGESGPATLR